MKNILPHLILRVLRNLLLIEILAVLLAAVFTRSMALYYSETFGIGLFGVGVILILLSGLMFGVSSRAGWQNHWRLWSGGLTEAAQGDPEARVSVYREAMKSSRAPLWQVAIFLAAVINLLAGAWLQSQHMYLPFFERF